MFFVKASEKDDEINDEIDDEIDDEGDYDESGSNDIVNDHLIKKDNLFGSLITVEDCFIRRKVFDKE